MAARLARARSRFPSRLSSRLSAVTKTGESTDAGFSLLEVVVSFVIFAIVAGAATGAIVSALRASHGSQQRVDAAQVAQQFVAQTQSSPHTVSQESNVVRTAIGLKNEHFNVTRSIVFSDPNSTSCLAGQYFTVHVSVVQQQSGQFLARSDSVVTC